MIVTTTKVKVFLRLGVTDMRKSINGLSMIVQGELELDPFTGHLFVFCNRRQNILKVLYWDNNGFCLWQKRLEEHQFKWPTDCRSPQYNTFATRLKISKSYPQKYKKPALLSSLFCNQAKKMAGRSARLVHPPL